MTLIRLEKDLKQAMRDRDVLRHSVIRMLRSALHNEKIAKQSELTEDQIIHVLSRQAQQRRDSVAAFERGNRPDLVKKEKSELAFIVEYLPQPMLRDDIIKLAEDIIIEEQAQGLRDMGKVMARIMPVVRGRADGREVSSIVTGLLSDN